MIHKPFAGKESKFALTKKNVTLMAASGALILSLAAPSVLAAEPPSDQPIADTLEEIAPADPDAKAFALAEVDADPVRLIVKYVDTSGNALMPQLELAGDVGAPYNLTGRDFEGYTKVSQAGGSVGFLEETVQTVTYTYLKTTGGAEIPADVTPPNVPVVNDVSAGDATITGKAEAGATVKAIFLGGKTASVVANSTGAFSMPVPDGVALAGNDTILVTSEDAAGNASGGRTVTVLSKLVAADPEDSVEKVRLIVKFVDDAGKDLAPSVQLSGVLGDKYQTMKSVVDGYEVMVVSGSESGVMGKEVKTVIYTYAKAKDVTAPELPTVTPFAVGDTAITGTVEAEATVKVTFPDKTTATAKATSAGVFSIAIPTGMELVAGTKLTLTATDAAGNASALKTVTIEEGAVDVTAPTTPTVKDFEVGDKEITGTTEAGATLTATFAGGKKVTSVAGTVGAFIIPIPADVTLKAADKFTVTATDKAGNVSTASTITVAPDTTAPEPPEFDEDVSDENIITGSTEPGATVSVTFKDGQKATAVADKDGRFVITIPEGLSMEVGDSVTVTATDEAGNVSDVSTVTVYEVDETAPGQPDINEVVLGDKVVTGVAEEGATVTVTFPNDAKATDVAESGDPDEATAKVSAVGDSGIFSVDVPEGVTLATGDKITATATDEAGNVSVAQTVTVVAEATPDEPADEAPVDDSREELAPVPTDGNGTGNGSGTGGTPAAESKDTKSELKSIPQAGAETNWLMVGLGTLATGAAAALLFMRRKASGIFSN